MVTDILVVTMEMIELFKKHDLTRVQSMFVLEAGKMQIYEELTREIIADSKKGHDMVAGIQ